MFRQSGVPDSQIDRNSIRKNVYSSKLILFHFLLLYWFTFLLFYFFTEICHWLGLFVWLLTHNFTSLSQCVDELTHLFIFFLMSLQGVKKILNITSNVIMHHQNLASTVNFSLKVYKPTRYIHLKNFIRMID